LSTKPTREELEQRIIILEEELAKVRREKEELCENAEMFENIINGVSMLITYMDCEERYVFVNQAYAEWYGVNPQELIGKRASDILKPDVYERASHNIKKALSGQQVSYENKVIDKHGRERHVRVNYEPCFNGGQVKGFYTSIVDITENKRAEDALGESESHMKSISDNLPDGMIYQIIAKADGTRQFTYLSDTVRKLHGISPKEGLADPNLIYSRIHEDDMASLMKAEDEALKTLSTFRMEARVREPSGGIRWSMFSSTPALMKDGSTRWNGIELVISERKRIEENLKKSEENFRRTLDDSPLGARIVSVKGETIYANQTFLNIYDYKGIEELQAIPAKERYTPESYAEHRSRSEKRKQGEFVPSEYEVSIIRKDGEIRHLQVIRKEILWNGQPQFQVLYNDITKRKWAEEALRESESRYRDLVKYAPSGIYEVDLEINRFVNVNDVICEYTGYTRDELLNTNLFNLLTEESQKLMAQRLEKLYAGEQIPPSVEYCFRTKGGEFIWAMLNTRYIYKAGRLKGATGISHNITERKRAEEALQKSEERLKSIVSTSQEWIWAIDNAGRHTFSNPASEKILGCHAEEIVGNKWQHLIHEEDIPRARELLSRSIEQKTGWSDIVLRWKHKNGTYRYLESNAMPILSSTGFLKGFQVLYNDITERKLAEEYQKSMRERLQRAEKMELLGRIAGKVAHDLNNVLGALTGYSELLLMELPKGQRARSNAEKIMQSTQKGAAIIQDLLTLARRGVMAAEVTNLNTVIAGFLKTPVFEGMKKHYPLVTFRTDFERKLLNIKASPIHMEKMLMNLLSNAVEAIPGTGVVSIRTENRYLDRGIQGYDKVKEGDYVVLTVSDTGTGIEAENLDKIFEPFYTRKSMGRSGTGLGLSIVWGTVKDHNGHIDVQSNVGEGTTFTLYFPVTREGMTLPQQKIPLEQYRGKGESVLVVDDIAEQRDVASGLLTQLGYKVQTVSGGEEAVEYLRKNQADILVLDMIMAPGIDGLETYQRILQINPKQKAILVSGFSETDRVREAQRLGAGVYVKKPYVMETIGMAIRDELNR